METAVIASGRPLVAPRQITCGVLTSLWEELIKTACIVQNYEIKLEEAFVQCSGRRQSSRPLV